MEDVICSLCNKYFASKGSLSNHKRNVHNVYAKEQCNPEKNGDNKYPCKHCKKVFAFTQSRWVHQKKCLNKKEMSKIEEELEEIKNGKIEQDKIIMELQQKLFNSNKLDTKTFKALNRMLIERSNINSNNTINNINNSVNHYHIVSLGKEEILEALTMQQKQQILDCRLNSLEKLVEIAHCGQINQFKNIIITNLKDNYAYKYDDEKGYFVTVQKNALLDHLITLRLTDIEEIYDELKEANKIDTKTRMVIQTFLDKMQNEKPVYENDTRYDNYRSYKIDNIKILLYNNQDNITKNIALLVSEKCPPPELENILIEN